MRIESQINGIVSPLLQKIRMRKAIPFVVGNRILDIGCSNGEILPYLSPDVEYIGIESNPDYYNNAKKRNPHHTFINLSIDDTTSRTLEIPKCTTILMLAILEHLERPLKVLINLKRYLSSKGCIIITTPSAFSHRVLAMGSKLGLFMKDMNEHRTLYSREALMAICEKSGMKVVHYSKFEYGFNQITVLKKE